MIYLSDHDLLEKPAACDLIDDALRSIGAERQDVRVLPTLRYRIGGKGRQAAERRLGEEAVVRLLSFLEDAREITDVPIEAVAPFEDLVGIDPGEAILFAASADREDSLILTGDKRCLRALVSNPECRAIARRLAGRVIPFEGLLIRIVAHLGFDGVLAKVTPALSCDTALRAAFGSGRLATEANAVGCLRRYVDEPRAPPIDLIAPRF